MELSRRFDPLIILVGPSVGRPDAPTTQRLIPATELRPIVRQPQVEGLRPGSTLSSHGFRYSR